MGKSSAAISLVLLGSASAAFIGYKAVTGPHHAGGVQSTEFNDGGSDFGPDDGQDGNAYDPAATQPSGPGTGHSNTYHTYTHYTHSGTSGYVGTSGFVGSSGRISSGSPGGSSGSAAHSAGTSRGGFGSTGHAVGHASS
jgi:hypothetical protein